MAAKESERKEKGVNRWYKHWIVDVIKLIILGLILAFSFEHFGVYGLLYIWLFFLAYSIYKVYMNWDMVKGLMQYIETIIWGKPLGKEYWTKKQWDNRTRRKFVWKKKGFKE